MRKKLFVGALLCTALFAFAAKDPVIMKINGKDIKLSEFEYLYKKNNKQQLEKETIEQYVDRFVTYKLKVAEAEELKLDTAKSFVAEFEGYKRDLSSPYFEDKEVTQRLAHECYEMMKRNVNVSNIFVNLGTDKKMQEEKKHKVDSIYQCLINGEDFQTLAVNCSEERAAKRTKGEMGFIKVGMLPYEFEKVAFSTPVGKISEPFCSQYGWHIIKVNDERADRGKVLVEHILKLYPRNATDEMKAAVYNKVDSIYDAVVGGANFEDAARKESEDHASAKNGGKLPWFGCKEMVEEFENVAFDLKDGEISKPFATRYGVHIVKKLASKPLGSFEEYEAQIVGMFANDERGTMGRKAKLETIKKELGFKVNPELDFCLEKLIAKSNGNDSLFFKSVKESEFDAFCIGKQIYKLSEITKTLKTGTNISVQGKKNVINSALNMFAEKRLQEKYVERLYVTDSNFRNLINEYHDGMLLFEVSNRRIWDGATKNTEAIEKYFNEHRGNYVWNEPKYKATIVLTINDSIKAEAKAFLASNVDNKNKFAELKEKYKKQVNVENVLVSKGENELVDYEVFGSGVKPTSKRYASSFIYEGHMLDAPENYTDVKIQVLGDYQAELEKQWVNDLKKKYPVVINKNVLKQVKE